MINYDKEYIKEQLTLENHFQLLDIWGGNPEYTNFGIVSATICHNEVGVGSRKLYYYFNSGLFICYSGGCEEKYFDLFELTRKVARIQWHKEISLDEAIRWIAQYFGIVGQAIQEDLGNLKDDYLVLDRYKTLQETEDINKKDIKLKKYDDNILNNLNYDIRLTNWEHDGITREVMRAARIGYYLGEDQITIPHYDIDGNFIGLRGRSMCKEDAERYGKYRPIKVNGIQYTHPLGLNLYGLNWNKDNISTMKTAIIFESEKSVLQYASSFGWENNISVAACGSSVSDIQVKLLSQLKVNEIVLAFDRQYESLNTEEQVKWKKKLLGLREKYKNDFIFSIIWDKENLLGYKESPTDRGKYVFLELFKKRIIL